MDIVIVDFVSPNNLEFRELISQVQIFVKSERQFRILQLLTRELILLRRGFLPTFLPVQHPNAGAALSGHDVVTFARSDLIRFEVPVALGSKSPPRCGLDSRARFPDPVFIASRSRHWRARTKYFDLSVTDASRQMSSVDTPRVCFSELHTSLVPGWAQRPN